MTRNPFVQKLGWSFGLMATALFVGCMQPPPASDATNLDDAQSDGFLDVMPPESVAFEPDTNVRIALVSEVDDSDIARVAELQGVPQEYIDLLSLVDIVASADLTLTFDNGATDVYSDSVVVGPFERKLEFACPQRVDVQARADAYLPLGEVQPLVQGLTTTLHQGADFNCGETLHFVVSVDDAGVLHVAEDDGTNSAAADSLASGAG
jgi:hypothetical protein